MSERGSWEKRERVEMTTIHHTNVENAQTIKCYKIVSTDIPWKNRDWRDAPPSPLCHTSRGSKFNPPHTCKNARHETGHKHVIPVLASRVKRSPGTCDLSIKPNTQAQDSVRVSCLKKYDGELLTKTLDIGLWPPHSYAHKFMFIVHKHIYPNTKWEDIHVFPYLS